MDKLEERVAKAICMTYWTKKTVPRKDYWKNYLPAAKAAINVIRTE